MPTLLSNRWVAQPQATLSPLQITTASLPGGTVGTAYSTSLAATGGLAPYTFSLLSSVPNTGAWLTCSSAGALSGTPGTAETEVVLAQVQDSQGTKASIFLTIVVAAGSVDGVSIVGSVVTINRAAGGFSAKATAAPLYYNNFESLSVGDLPSATGLTNSLDATVVNVQNDRSFTGTKSMKGVYPANTESFPEVSYLPPANTAEIYVSGMMYWNVASPPQTGSPIFKSTRMGVGVLYHGTPSQYQTLRPSGGVVTGGDWGYTTGTFVAWPSALYWGTPNTLPGPNSDQWNFMEWSHGFSNPSGGATGYSEMRCNAQNSLTPTTIGGHSAFVNQTTGANVTTGNTNNSGANAFFTWVIPFFDGMSGPGSNATSLWVDELYIDNCRNRVVVTDNAVFASSTKFLMLVPSQWVDTQVVGTNGALTTLFPTGSTANFHIFNSSGSEVINYPKVMP